MPKTPITQLLPTKSNVKLLTRDAETGKLFLKVFLLDTTKNGNQWSVDPETVDENIQSAKGRPLVLYRDSGQEPDRSWYPRIKGMYNHPPWDDYDINHTLEMQETFRVGNIEEVVKNQETGAWWGIVEVTNPGVKKILNENPTLPFYVSPSIRMVKQHQASQSIRDWVFMHSAVVSVPAFGVQKAYTSGRCSGDRETCVLQFRNASLTNLTRNKDNTGWEQDCGFCTYEAMKQASEHVSRTINGTTNQTNNLNTSHLTISPNFEIGQSLSDPNTINAENVGVSNAATVPEQNQNLAANEAHTQQHEQKQQQFTQPQQRVTVERKQYPNPQTTTLNPQSNTSNNKSESNAAGDDVDLLVQIERRKNQLAAAYQEINKLARDNRKLASEAANSTTRLASMETYIKEQQRLARENQIAEIIYNANLADLVSEDVKENQIKLLVDSPFSIEQVKNITAPWYGAFDAFIEAQRNGGVDSRNNITSQQVPQPTTANASRGSRLDLRNSQAIAESNTKNASLNPTMKAKSSILDFKHARQLMGIVSAEQEHGGSV